MKEIRQLGIMNVVHVRRIGHHQVDRGVREVGAPRVTPGHVRSHGDWRPELSKPLDDPAAEWCGQAGDTPDGAASGHEIVREDLVRLGSQYAALEKSREGTRRCRRAPRMSFEGHAFGLENVVVEHVPDRSGALALVGAEQVVEFQDAREQRGESLAFRAWREISNGRAEQAETVQLPSVEELLPPPISPTHRLTGVPTVLEPPDWKDEPVPVGEQQPLGLSHESYVALVD